jgi:SPP1 family holin
MNKINLKGVSTQTWARTVVLLIALVCQLCVILGKTDRTIDVDVWQEYATYALTVIGSVWSWWKNNSFTKAAQKADSIVSKLKSETEE